jgi:hypothetical protein
MSDGVSFGELWNAAKDVAVLFQNGESVNMTSRAFAVPAGKQPMDLDWTSQADRTLQITWKGDSYASEIGISSGTKMRVGAKWMAGGRLEGKGLFLHDAYLYCVFDDISLAQSFEVTGAFGDAVLVGQTAELSGWIRVHWKQFTVDWGSWQYDIKVRGDGSGNMSRI